MTDEGLAVMVVPVRWEHDGKTVTRFTETTYQVRDGGNIATIWITPATDIESVLPLIGHL